MNTKPMPVFLRMALMVAMLVLPMLVLPMVVFAQDCLNYETYLHWVGGLDLETGCRAVVIDGDYAFVVRNQFVPGTLEIIDISDPAAPFLFYELELTGHSSDIVLAGDYAYIADGWAGFQVVDLSDLSAPVVVANVPTPAFVRDVALYDHYAVVAEWNTGRLHVIDVSNPEAPILVGGVDAQDDIQELIIDGDFAYVLYRFIYPGTAGLQVFDLADPMVPLLISDTLVQDWGHGLVVNNGVAYVISGSLQTFDVSNPADPVLLGAADIPGGGKEIVVHNDRAYVTRGLGSLGLVVLDVSSPSEPAILGVVNTRDEARGLAINGSYAYLANSYSGLNIFDVSVPFAPPEGIHLEIPMGSVVFAGAGQFVYLAGYGTNNFHVIDGANPSAPVVLGHVDTPGDIWDIAVVAQHAYVTDDSTGLHVIDVADPNDPQIVDVDNSLGQITCLTANENYLFAANADLSHSYLQMMDISEPWAPSIVGSVELPRLAQNMVAEGNLVYVTNKYNPDFTGLTIVETSDPATAEVVGMIDIPGDIYNLTIDGSVAYLVGLNDSRALLTMVDVSDPAQPVMMGEVMLPGLGYAVVVHNGFAYVAVSRLGMVVVDVFDPYGGFVVGVTADDVSMMTPRDVLLLGERLYLTSASGLAVCLPQCGGTVAVFDPGFTATCTMDEISLQWTSSIEDDAEFQVEGRQGSRQWLVPHSSDGHGKFRAFDDIAGWVEGEQRTYSLRFRQPGGQWLTVGSETLDMVSPRPESGFTDIQPNPFNPKTSVSFHVQHTQQVEIAVYDLSGKRVAVLVDQIFETGEHITHWDGRDARGRAVSSGTYFVRMETNQHAESKKIMLVR